MKGCRRTTRSGRGAALCLLVEIGGILKPEPT